MNTILCYGDSNTYGANPSGGRWPRSVRWTGLLQTYLGPKYYCIEEGLGGRDTVFDDPMSAGRNGLSYLPISLQSHWPLDMVILGLGTNDCKALFNASPRVIAKGLETIVKTIRGFELDGGLPPDKILIISPIHIGEDIEHSQFASYDRSSYEKSLLLAPLFKQVADAYDCLFLDASTLAKPSEIDQLHMDAAGHQALAEALASMIRDAFDDESPLDFGKAEEGPEEQEPVAKSEAPSPAEMQNPKPKKGSLFKIPGFSRRKED